MGDSSIMRFKCIDIRVNYIHFILIQLDFTGQSCDKKVCVVKLQNQLKYNFCYDIFKCESYFVSAM